MDSKDAKDADMDYLRCYNIIRTYQNRRPIVLDQMNLDSVVLFIHHILLFLGSFIVTVLVLSCLLKNKQNGFTYSTVGYRTRTSDIIILYYQHIAYTTIETKEGELHIVR